MRAALGKLIPANPATRRFAAVTLVDSIGSGMSLTASVLFLTRLAGLTSGQIGIGLSVSAGVALLLSVPVAVAAERLGIVRALVLLQVWRGGWFLAYLAVGSFPAYLVVCCMLGLALRVVSPLTQSVVAASTTESARVTTMALLRSVQNAGFGLGALAGTLVIGVGSKIGLAGLIVLNAVSFFVAAALLRGLPLRATPVARVRRVAGWRQLRSLRDGRYLLLTALNGALVLHMTLLTVGLPLWIVEHTEAPPSVIGLCLLANTVLVVLLQVRASRGCDDLPVAAGRLRRAGAALAAFCVLLALSSQLTAGPAVVAVLLAAIALTLGELWHSAGAWGISFELAPPDRRTEYLAVFNLGTIVQGIVGPTLVTALVLPHGGWGWLLLGTALLLVAVTVPAVVRRATPPLDARRPAEVLVE
ncbi:MFS transporter [Micromonospora sp. NPDC049523]|uniref:MFS transporter n=1 Tax=Micromonospora sp. NPDC049523 TaxID=3155921 RepID=UPI00342AC686